MKDIKSKILSNEEIGSGYYKMALEAPYIARLAKPGQFVQIRCSDSYEPFLRRPFSIHRLKAEGSPRCRAPGYQAPPSGPSPQRPSPSGRGRCEARLKGIEILYEVVGKGTEILAKKKEGEFLDILGPLGNGFILPGISSLKPRAIIIAGGIGVAPLVFLAEKLTEIKNQKSKIKIIVLIGAKTKKLILCQKDFKKLTQEVYVSTDDGTYGCKGFVSKLFHKILCTAEHNFNTIVYVCGPGAMLRCISDICRGRRFECQVSLEEFMSCGIGACLGCVVKTRSGNRLACKDGPVFNSEEIVW